MHVARGGAAEGGFGGRLRGFLAVRAQHVRVVGLARHLGDVVRLEGAVGGRGAGGQGLGGEFGGGVVAD